MAKGKKTGGKNIQPGQVLNPIGANAHNPVTKALRKLTQEKLEEIADLILDGNRGSLTAIVASHEESSLRVAYAKAALNAMSRGDLSQIEIILNRLLGKVKDKVEHSGSVSLEELVVRQGEE